MDVDFRLNAYRARLDMDEPHWLKARCDEAELSGLQLLLCAIMREAATIAAFLKPGTGTANGREYLLSKEVEKTPSSNQRSGFAKEKVRRRCDF